MGKVFVNIPEGEDLERRNIDGFYPSKKNTSVLNISREKDIPTIVIQRKTGNIDIRAEDGSSLVKIDAVGQKLFIKEDDIGATIERHKTLAKGVETLKKTIERLKSEVSSLENSIPSLINTAKESLEEKITENNIKNLRMESTKVTKHLMITGKGKTGRETASSFDVNVRCLHYFTDKGSIFFRVSGQYDLLNKKFKGFFQSIKNPTVAFEAKLNELGVPRKGWPREPFPLATIFDGRLTVMPGSIFVDAGGKFEFIVSIKKDKE